MSAFCLPFAQFGGFLTRLPLVIIARVRFPSPAPLISGHLRKSAVNYRLGPKPSSPTKSCQLIEILREVRAIRSRTWCWDRSQRLFYCDVSRKNFVCALVGTVTEI